jgi:hypothetical protein
MQDYPRRKEQPTLHAQRMPPALPDAAMPMTPAPGVQGYVRTFYATSKPGNVLSILLLICIGLLIEGLLLALLLALASPPGMVDRIQKAVPGLLPALIACYHQPGIQPFSSFLKKIAWLNPATGMGRANCALALLALTMILLLVATRIGTRIMHGKNGDHPQVERSALFWLILLPAILFGATMIYAPLPGNVMSQDMLWYGLYGRMIVLYHVNPYTATHAMLSYDMLYGVISDLRLPGGLAVTSPTGTYGPVWLDTCLLVVLFAQDTMAHIVYGFRAIGLAAHILNSMLLWMLLTKWKPEIRVSSMLLYAWNPVILLLGVAQMHAQIVVTLFILLATFFFLRSSALLGWIFVVLGVLICPFYLILIPLFLRLLGSRTPSMTSGRRFLWWIIVCLVSILVLLLAYAPYWQDWGIAGLWTQIKGIFIQHYALNSLDAIFQTALPHGSTLLVWIMAPHNWSLLVLGLAGIFLLFGYWLTDTPQFVALCGSGLVLIMVMLQPVYWPWYVILPFALALCSVNRSVILLATLLVIGASLAYYYCLWQPAWPRQALFTIGMPLIIAGWALFFNATWRLTRVKMPEEKRTRPRLKGLSRPAWLSRPSQPSRPPRC